MHPGRDTRQSLIEPFAATRPDGEGSRECDETDNESLDSAALSVLAHGGDHGRRDKVRAAMAEAAAGGFVVRVPTVVLATAIHQGGGVVATGGPDDLEALAVDNHNVKILAL